MERRCGDLATIADQQTLDFIKNNIALKNTHTWIGAERSSGEWKWADGTPWSFTAWGNLIEKENWVDPAIIYSADYKWYNQVAGNSKYPYICQY